MENNPDFVYLGIDNQKIYMFMKLQFKVQIKTPDEKNQSYINELGVYFGQNSVGTCKIIKMGTILIGDCNIEYIDFKSISDVLNKYFLYNFGYEKGVYYLAALTLFDKEPINYKPVQIKDIYLSE